MGAGPLLVGLSNDYLFQVSSAIGLSLSLTIVALSLIGVPLALCKRDAYQSVVAKVHCIE
jgi:hypothetical protein